MQGTTFGRYQFIELLGRGGMGEVWRAYDTETQRVVAVKVLPANLANDPTFEQRFRREALAAAGLNDPHVVPIHHFGEIEGRLYVDMRLVVGRDLQHIIADGALDPDRAVSIIEQTASALRAAHRVGLVHRDVKPSNILVTEDDFAYLIDFGIARAAGDSHMTKTGNVIGTWAYMAPERVTTGQTDPRGDTYALGCVLHECLTGSQPFPGNSLEQQIGAHLSMPPPRPSAIRRGIPEELDTVVATAMAKNPEQRYSTITEMATAARDAVTGTRPIPMRRPEPVRQPKPPGPSGPVKAPPPGPPSQRGRGPTYPDPSQRGPGPTYPDPNQRRPGPTHPDPNQYRPTADYQPPVEPRRPQPDPHQYRPTADYQPPQDPNSYRPPVEPNPYRPTGDPNQQRGPVEPAGYRGPAEPTQRAPVDATMRAPVEPTQRASVDATQRAPELTQRAPAEPTQQRPNSQPNPPAIYRSPADVTPAVPWPADAEDGADGLPSASGKRRRTPFILAGAAVLTVIAVVVAFVVFGGDSGGGETAAPSGGEAPAVAGNDGPFSGTYTADFGPKLSLAGTEVPNSDPPGQETWVLRSACGNSGHTSGDGCVATAQRTSGSYQHTPKLVFDDVRGRWIAVALEGGKCNDQSIEKWNYVWLQPRADGSMVGEWITDSMDCYSKRKVTFKRTGDADLPTLANPGEQPARVVSPGQSLHGRYHLLTTYTGPNAPQPQEADYTVDTFCLRTGDRCLSRFVRTTSSGTQLLHFANDAWTRDDTYDAACPAGGTSHVSIKGTFPLPEPRQDPIAVLTGNGIKDETGTSCKGGPYDMRFTRTGDS